MVRARSPTPTFWRKLVCRCTHAPFIGSLIAHKLAHSRCGILLRTTARGVIHLLPLHFSPALMIHGKRLDLAVGVLTHLTHALQVQLLLQLLWLATNMNLPSLHILQMALSLRL